MENTLSIAADDGGCDPDADSKLLDSSNCHKHLHVTACYVKNEVIMLKIIYVRCYTMHYYASIKC